MAKKELGNRPFLYPYPVTIVGAEVDGKPNYMTIAFIGIVNMNPGMIAFGAGRGKHTVKGVLENKVFSVNIPSEKMLAVTDFAGMYSGSKIDKTGLFEVFYGKLGKAPLIKECPLNLECRLVQVLDLGGNDQIFIGEIVETYVDEQCLTDGLPDVEKMRPMVFTMFDNRYFGLGSCLGKAWSAGKDYRPVSG